MEGFFSIIFIFIMFLLIFKSFGRNIISTEDETDLETVSYQSDDLVIEDISDKLDTVNKVMQQIKNVEELITDIEICEPGRNLSFQFWEHGGDKCRKSVTNMQAAERMRNMRRRTRAINKARKENLELLEEYFA